MQTVKLFKKALLLSGVFIFSANAASAQKKTNSPTLVIFDFYKEDERNKLDCNYLSKRKKDDKIRFSRGIDACGILDQFFYDIQEEKPNFPIQEMLNKCVVIPVQRIRPELMNKDEVYVLEVTIERDTTIYPVRWKRKFNVQ